MALNTEVGLPVCLESSLQQRQRAFRSLFTSNGAAAGTEDSGRLQNTNY